MKNILIVDDEDINRLCISAQIKRNFQSLFNIYQEANWFDAIKSIRKQNYDFIIMDYSMPWMNWGDTLEIRKDMGWAWVGIWYTSHNFYDMKEVWEHFLKAWANKVFLKHDELDDMLNFIKNTNIRVFSK